MVKLSVDQIEPVLQRVIDRVVNDPAMKGNRFHSSISGNWITRNGYIFTRYDPGPHAPVYPEEILGVFYTGDRDKHFYPETDLKLKIGRTVFRVVESDDLTPVEYEKQLYDAVRDGLVRSLREKGYITDESPAMLPSRSELHWHAINRLADIIEKSILHLRNCSI